MLGHGGSDGFRGPFACCTGITAFTPLLNILVATNPVVPLSDSVQGFCNP